MRQFIHLGADNPLAGMALLLAIAFYSLTGWAQDEANEQTVFDLGSSEYSGLDSGAEVRLSQASFTDNPISSWLKSWPEDLVLAPIPGYSPQLGWTLSMVGGYFLDVDKKHPDTPPSIVGAAVMGAENGSFAFGSGAKFYLLDDTVRVTAGALYGDIKYRFYGVGNEDGEDGKSIEIQQQTPLFYAAATYEWFKNTYIGMGLHATSIKTTLYKGENLPEGLPDPVLENRTLALHIPLEYDTRDDQLFPTHGWLVRSRLRLYREALASDFDANIFNIAVNRYINIRGTDVLAFRAYFQGVGGDAPFYLLSAFGGHADLRGYETGRYRDKLMYAVQGEYRWRPVNSWVFTGFVGVGEVAPTVSGFFDNFLPAAGIGARFMLSKKHNFSISTDLAVGKDSFQFYFGVGEAF